MRQAHIGNTLIAMPPGDVFVAVTDGRPPRAGEEVRAEFTICTAFVPRYRTSQ